MQSQYLTVEQISSNIEKTPEGFLICKNVPIMRSGNLEYPENETPIESDGSGITIVNKPLSVLHDAETISSLEGKPITIDHPFDDVTPENYKDVSVGTLQNVRAGQGEMKNYVISDMLINDKDAIEKVLSHEVREVSVGGAAIYSQTAPGIGDQEYIFGNHVALVKEGRAGPTCAIQDSKGDKMSLKEKIGAIFRKAEKDSFKMLDEAMPKDVVDKDVIEPEANNEEMDSIKDSVKSLKESNETILKSFESLKDLIKLKSDEKEKDDKKESEDNVEDAPVDVDSDTVARAEILMPGMSKVGDVKSTALKGFYSTKDGKTILDPMLAGRKIEDVDKDMLFVTASEIVKSKRRSSFSDSSQRQSSGSSDKSLKTIDQINETNKNFWNKGAK